VKDAWIRIVGIGIFHMFLYVYLVPFVIYPRYGSNGLVFTIVTAVIISIAVLGTLWIGNKKNSKRR
jgi:heme/copper-type cytochrome/quinol oxidase subunit 4